MPLLQVSEYCSWTTFNGTTCHRVKPRTRICRWKQRTIYRKTLKVMLPYKRTYQLTYVNWELKLHFWPLSCQRNYSIEWNPLETKSHLTLKKINSYVIRWSITIFEETCFRTLSWATLIHFTSFSYSYHIKDPVSCCTCLRIGLADLGFLNKILYAFLNFPMRATR